MEERKKEVYQSKVSVVMVIVTQRRVSYAASGIFGPCVFAARAPDTMWQGALRAILRTDSFIRQMVRRDSRWTRSVTSWPAVTIRKPKLLFSLTFDLFFHPKWGYICNRPSAPNTSRVWLFLCFLFLPSRCARSSSPRERRLRLQSVCVPDASLGWH